MKPTWLTTIILVLFAAYAGYQNGETIDVKVEALPFSERTLLLNMIDDKEEQISALRNELSKPQKVIRIVKRDTVYIERPVEYRLEPFYVPTDTLWQWDRGWLQDSIQVDSLWRFEWT